MIIRMTLRAMRAGLLLCMMNMVACSDGGSGGSNKADDAGRHPDAGGKDAGGKDAGGMRDAGPSGPAVELMTLAQIGAVVKDAAAASSSFTKMLGVGPWKTVEQKGVNASGAAFSAKLAYAYVGDLELELVEVTSGETPQTKFLNDHGEGMYDLGFFVDDVDDAADRLAKRGAEILLQEKGKWAYVDSPDAGGVIFKLTQMRDKFSIDATGFKPPAKSLRPMVIDHVGAWVTDAQATTERWESTFGIGMWNLFPFAATSSDGDPLEATLAFTSDLGPTQVELVQTMDAKVPAKFSELMRGDGRGLWETAIKIDDPAAEAATLVDLGARIIGQTDDDSTFVIDIGAGGVAIELLKPSSS